jgi:hypothetical protein
VANVPAIAECPIGYALVGAHTTGPSPGALGAFTFLFGFVRSVATVVIIVTSPRLWNAFLVAATELFLCAVSGRILTKCFGLIAPIPTIVVPITGEPFGDAFARVGTFEHPIIAGLITIFLIASVATVFKINQCCCYNYNH